MAAATDAAAAATAFDVMATPDADPLWELVRAIQREDLSVIRASLERVDSVNDLRGGKSPLMYAIHSSREICKDIIDILVAQGADFSLEDRCGQTAFMHAIISGLRTPISLFFEVYSADAHAEASNGLTPVLQAIRHFKPRVMDQIVRYGVDLNKCTSKGLCPLTFAVQNDIPSAVAYLMSVPSVDVNVLMPDGRFPLLIASETDDRIQCISLLANAADIDLNKESTEGMTSLMVAVAENRLLALQALLAFGADVNYRSRLLGSTPLKLAMQRRHERAAEILLANGAHEDMEDVVVGSDNLQYRGTVASNRRCCNKLSALDCCCQ